MKDYKKLGKIDEFIIYFDTVDKDYFGVRIGFKDEIIRADTLEEIKDRALNYRNELADFLKTSFRKACL